MKKQRKRIFGIFRCKEEVVFILVTVLLALFLVDFQLLPKAVVGVVLICLGIGMLMEDYLLQKYYERLGVKVR
jgi:membrane-bound ClpP family serine protease